MNVKNIDIRQLNIYLTTISQKKLDKSEAELSDPSEKPEDFRDYIDDTAASKAAGFGVPENDTVEKVSITQEGLNILRKILNSQKSDTSDDEPRAHIPYKP